MNKKELVERLQFILETHPLSEEDKKAIEEAIIVIQKEKWLEAAKLIVAVLQIAEKFLPDKWI